MTVPELLASSSSVKMLLLPYWLNFRVVVVAAMVVFCSSRIVFLFQLMLLLLFLRWE